MILSNYQSSLTHPVFHLVSEIIAQDKREAYVVGGFVRDLLLNRPSKDIDIVVLGSGIELAEQLAKRLGKKTRVVKFKNFGTAMIHFEDWEIELVGARKESYQRNSRKPIVEDGTLEEDQNRRDFTINALAIDLRKESFGQLIDPFNGLKDLEEKTIRTPLDPDITFSDDPLRMIRAIRFAAQLHFRIETETFEAIKRNANRLDIISRERISDELNKIMLSSKPSVGWNLLEMTSLLPQFFPELQAMKGVDYVDGKGHKDNFYHTLEVLDCLAENSDNLWLRWAALLHDIAKPPTKKFYSNQGWTFHGHEFLGAKMVPGIFKALRLPLNEKMRSVQKLVLLHLRPIVLAEDFVTDSAVRRLLFDAGDEIDNLMTLAEADITSKNESKKKRFLQNFQIVRRKLKEIEEKDAIRNFQPPISGEMIMELFDIPPSRKVGLIKDAIKEAILEGEIRNDYDEAYGYMLILANNLGLKVKK